MSAFATDVADRNCQTYTVALAGELGTSCDPNVNLDLKDTFYRDCSRIPDLYSSNYTNFYTIQPFMLHMKIGPPTSH